MAVALPDAGPGFSIRREDHRLEHHGIGIDPIGLDVEVGRQRPDVLRREPVFLVLAGWPVQPVENAGIEYDLPFRVAGVPRASCRAPSLAASDAVRVSHLNPCGVRVRSGWIAGDLQPRRCGYRCEEERGRNPEGPGADMAPLGAALLVMPVTLRDGEE